MASHSALLHFLGARRGGGGGSITVTSANGMCRWGPLFSTNHIFSSLISSFIFCLIGGFKRALFHTVQLNDKTSCLCGAYVPLM
ncbi:hypothetical protein Hanom_Chr02g00095801 [Helianthus anomalus]